MPAARPNRCPSCGKLIDVTLLAFSAAHNAFVCPSCRKRGVASSLDEPPSERSSKSFDDLPSNSLPRYSGGGLGRGLSQGLEGVPTPQPFPGAPEEGEKPPTGAIQPALPSSFPADPIGATSPRGEAARRTRGGGAANWLLPAAVILLAAVGITGIVIALLPHTSVQTGAEGFSNDERAWEIAHHDQIIALKSAAESLAIQGKLPEAHAKYRELEKLLGGRTVKDAQLFDIVAQARQDQDRIYALIVGQMELKQEQAKAQAQVRQPVGETGSSVGENVLPMGENAPLPPQAAPTPSQPPRTSATTEPVIVPKPETTRQPINPTASTESNPSPLASVPVPTTGPSQRVTDKQVGDAIQGGVEFLLSQLKDGHFPADKTAMPNQVAGLNALMVYALLQSGIAIHDPRLTAKGTLTDELLTKLKADRMSSSGTFNTPTTYGRSLRACALATYNRPQDRDQLQNDVRWLIHASDHGAYTYDDRYAARSRATEVLPPELARVIAASMNSTPSPDTPGEGWGGGKSAGRPDQVPDDARGGAQLLGTSTTRAPVILAHGLHGPDGQEIGYYPPGAGNGVGPPAPGAGYGGGRSGPGRHGTAPGAGFGRTSNAPGAGYTGGGKMTHNATMQGGGIGISIAVPRGPISPFFQNVLPEHPYVPPPKYNSAFPWDNSNSQYGLLGVWAGAEVGIEVPENYWRNAEQHWQSCQLRTGQWNYNGAFPPGRGYFSMTVAGIASLFVTHDYLEAPLMTAGHMGGRNPYTPPLAAGLAWLETGDHSVNLTGLPLFYYGYNLFGLERVGLASGFKYFGKHDWYSELAATVLASQRADGAFSYRDGGAENYEADRDIINTCYSLLFLARGRHPVMYNKLRFDDFWTNRPRDIANLTRYASTELERPLNWQVVNIDRDPYDWADAPVLYIASNHPPKMDEQDLAKLQAFVEQGGLLFTHADLASESFNGWAAQLAKQLFPDYPLKELPADSPIYNLQYKIGNPRPRLLGVFNGSRLLMVHSPRDLAGAWQTRSTLSRKSAFQLGVNIFLYAIGKEQFRNRLDTRAVGIPIEKTPRARLEVARIQYNGNWDPERGAWIRFALKLEDRTGIRLLIHTETPAGLDPAKFRLALLTGTDGRIPTDADLAPLRQFVEQGGILFVEPTGGSRAFAAAVEPWLDKLGAGTSAGSMSTTAATGSTTAPTTAPAGAILRTISADDPLLAQAYPGAPDLSREQLRLYALTQLGTSSPMHIKTMRLGKGQVIYTPLDLSSGLLGTDTWGIIGYQDDYSEAMASNLVREAMK